MLYYLDESNRDCPPFVSKESFTGFRLLFTELQGDLETYINGPETEDVESDDEYPASPPSRTIIDHDTFFDIERKLLDALVSGNTNKYCEASDNYLGVCITVYRNPLV